MAFHWDTDSQQLRIRLANRRLPFHKYQLLCEWLDCYSYIKPGDRTIYFPLTRVVEISTASDAFNMYLWLSCIECTLSLYDQQILCQLILEY